MREKKCMQRLRTAEARATVFGHFDPNLSNLIVMSTGDCGKPSSVYPVAVTVFTVADSA